VLRKVDPLALLRSRVSTDETTGWRCLICAWPKRCGRTGRSIRRIGTPIQLTDAYNDEVDPSNKSSLGNEPHARSRKITVIPCAFSLCNPSNTDSANRKIVCCTLCWHKSNYRMRWRDRLERKYLRAVCLGAVDSTTMFSTDANTTNSILTDGGLRAHVVVPLRRLDSKLRLFQRLSKLTRKVMTTMY
jgi:hypothetical protein